MLKWTYLAAAAAWAASMIYEWRWSGKGPGMYVAWAVVGLTLFLGLFVLVIRAENRTGRPKSLSPMEWFLMAAVLCAAFYASLEHMAKGHITHIPLLPMYIVLFLDFFGAGCYTLWKKRKG